MYRVSNASYRDMTIFSSEREMGKEIEKGRKEIERTYGLGKEEGARAALFYTTMTRIRCTPVPLHTSREWSASTHPVYTYTYLDTPTHSCVDYTTLSEAAARYDRSEKTGPLIRSLYLPIMFIYFCS